LYTRSKKFSPKKQKGFRVACHTTPLKKAKKQGETPLPSLCPIPLNVENVEFAQNGIVLELRRTADSQTATLASLQVFL